MPKAISSIPGHPSVCKIELAFKVQSGRNRVPPFQAIPVRKNIGF
jgi:hypothetical protein